MDMQKIEESLYFDPQSASPSENVGAAGDGSIRPEATAPAAKGGKYDLAGIEL
jgi:hypothetical protein